MDVRPPKFEYQKRLTIEDIENKFGDIAHVVFKGAEGQTAANYSVFYNVTNPMELIRLEVSYTTASTSGTLQLEKLTGTQAPGGGSTILLTTVNLAATANTVITRERPVMTSSRTFKQGDRIAFIDGGNLANLTDLVVNIYLKPLGRGDYR